MLYMYGIYIYIYTYIYIYIYFVTNEGRHERRRSQHRQIRMQQPGRSKHNDGYPRLATRAHRLDTMRTMKSSTKRPANNRHRTAEVARQDEEHQRMTVKKRTANTHTAMMMKTPSSKPDKPSTCASAQ